MDVTQTLEKFRTLTDIRETLKERYVSVKNARRTLTNAEKRWLHAGQRFDGRYTGVTQALPKR